LALIELIVEVELSISNFVLEVLPMEWSEEPLVVAMAEKEPRGSPGCFLLWQS